MIPFVPFLGDPDRLALVARLAADGAPRGVDPRDAARVIGFSAELTRMGRETHPFGGITDDLWRTANATAEQLIRAVQAAAPVPVAQAIEAGRDYGAQFKAALTSIDPSTPAGLRELARWLPSPLNVLVSRLPDYMRCLALARSVTDESARTSAIVECGIRHVLFTIFDFLESPEFRLTLDAMTGDIVGAVVAGARIAVDRLLLVLSVPTVRDSLGIGRQDYATIEATLKLVVKSPDLLMMFVEHGGSALREAFFYHAVGGILQAVTTAETVVTDVGFLFAYNAELLAALSRGEAAKAEEWFQRLYVAPVQARYDLPREVRRSGGALGGVIQGLGILVGHFASYYERIPIAFIAQGVGGPVREVGAGLQSLGATVKSWLGDRPAKIPPAIDWEGRLNAAIADRDKATRERDQARALLLAQKGVDLTKPQWNVTGALVGGAAGLLIGGPLVGAAGGLLGAGLSTGG